MRTHTSSVAVRARRKRFERSVERAVARLPVHIREHLNNVQIVVEDEPPAGDRDGDDELFGLYEGTPLAERDGSYSMVLPDKITVFRGPLERAFADPAEMEAEIQITVWHELAHHFGFDEDAIDGLGLA
jgi:predicted Zn-dependent protease with MMP-like domain